LCQGNKKAAYGLKRAEAAGIPTTYHSKFEYSKKHGADAVAANEEFCKEYVLFVSLIQAFLLRRVRLRIRQAMGPESWWLHDASLVLLEDVLFLFLLSENHYVSLQASPLPKLIVCRHEA